MRKLLTAVLCLFFAQFVSAQDTVRMRNNSFLIGETVDVDEDYITIQTGAGENRKLEKLSVEGIQYIRYKNGFLEKYHAAELIKTDTVQLVNYTSIIGTIVEVGDSILSIKTYDSAAQVKNILIDSIATIAYANGFKEKYNALSIQTVSGARVNVDATQKKDKLYTVQGLEYDGFISEVTDNSVKLIVPDARVPVIELNKGSVARIVYANGYVENYNLPVKGVTLATEDVSDKEEKEKVNDANEEKTEESTKPGKKLSAKEKEAVAALKRASASVIASTPVADLVAIPVSKTVTNPQAVRSLALNGKFMKKVPDGLTAYTEAAVLNLNNNLLKDVPGEVFSMPKLELLKIDSCLLNDVTSKADFNNSKIAYLSARFNRIKSVDSKILTLPALKTINLSNNQLSGFDGFKSARNNINVNIVSMNLSDNRLKEIPEELQAVHNLKTLNLINNQIKNLEIDSTMFGSLETLYLRGNPLTKLKNEFFQLTSLQTLFLDNTKVERIDSIGRLTSLRVVTLPNTLKAVPRGIVQNENLREFYLMGNPNVTAFPDQLLSNAKLEVINLNGTPIKYLPSRIGELKRLKILSLSNCGITTVPESLFQLARIKQIDLSGNQIVSIPKNLGDLAQLELLNLENSPVNGDALMNLRKVIPFAYIKYFSTELGFNFESKPVGQDEEPRFQLLLNKCLSKTGDACYELGQFFEKRNDFGYAFKLYYMLANQIAKEGTEESAIAYTKIAELYNDRKNRFAYNSKYKTREYSDYDDYSQNIGNNMALKIYCKLCDEAPADIRSKPVIKRACAQASLVYNETVDNLKKIFDVNTREIERLIGSAGNMNNLSSAGTSLVNAAQSNTTTLLGAGLSIFGKVSSDVKETKAQKKQKENNLLKRRIEDLNNTAKYYLNKAN